MYKKYKQKRRCRSLSKKAVNSMSQPFSGASGFFNGFKFLSFLYVFLRKDTFFVGNFSDFIAECDGC